MNDVVVDLYVGEPEKQSPMQTVDDVINDLRLLSSLCHMMSLGAHASDEVSRAYVADAMVHLRDRLDEQIRTLHGIDWKHG